ncbi:MAG: Mini-ribonuclease 3 [Erysipelotrichaceae bacterium]|nr:Mini-ribonuclease 3 [Erysipelotrichaceae bacterium]
MQANELNGLSLAYIGDAIYELEIRKYILSLGYRKVNDLHKRVVKFTSGAKQAEFIHYFLENNILTEEEISIFKRGRNSHVNTSRKNINIQDYLDATGFEALIGYLYLSGNNERLNSLMNIIFSI